MMMTVKSLAAAANVTPDTVRHYVRVGLLHPERNPQNGYRQFSKSDVGRLRFITLAKSLGFTLSEITEVFADAEAGDSPCPRVREFIQRHIRENRQQIDELLTLQTRMELSARQWQDMDDGMPHGDSICWLIEAIDA
ncbi:MAG TPA: MerR family transcriptional regulator [Mariprofundaceae bacterium]|nr:MerR family transcriptional regulator [Mariprofundaceae bacterium]